MLAYSFNPSTLGGYCGGQMKLLIQLSQLPVNGTMC